MYDLLDLYAEPYDPKKPVVAIDEKPKQLIADSRKSVPMTPGNPEKVDYEYVRNGTANIFVAVEPRGGRRKTKVTDHRCKPDFALFMKEVVDNNYPDAEVIRCVVDNLNTHVKSSFCETFDKKEADRLWSKLEFHYTPKHASWLNAAEIEIGVMDHECTDRRIKDKDTLAREVAAWTARRNKHKKKINWTFTKENADTKLSKYYIT